MHAAATDFLLAGPDVAEAIRTLTQDRGADYTVEAVGLPAVQETCLAAARPGGTIILAGLAPMGSSTNLPGATITRQEKTVKGSYYGSASPARDFPFFADLYLQKRLDLDQLVSRTYTLEQVNEAYADMLAGVVAGARFIVLDLSEVQSVDSSALAVMVRGMKSCRERNGELLLCGLRQPVSIIFELTRMDQAFRIFKDEASAELQSRGSSVTASNAVPVVARTTARYRSDSKPAF